MRFQEVQRDPSEINFFDRPGLPDVETNERCSILKENFALNICPDKKFVKDKAVKIIQGNFLFF